MEEKKLANIVTPEEEKGVFEKLLEIDEKVALVMTMEWIQRVPPSSNYCLTWPITRINRRFCDKKS